MNWSQFKYPVCHMCLSGAVVASWSLTQEVAGSNIFVTEFSVFSDTFRENSTMFSPHHIILSRPSSVGILYFTAFDFFSNPNSFS